MSAPRWMRDATRPTPEEEARLTGLPADLRTLAQSGTEPLQDEIVALRGRSPSDRQAAEPGRVRAVGVGVAVALVALVTLVLVAGSLVGLPDSRPFHMAGSASWTSHVEGPSIEVVQGEGIAAWEVDPVRPSGVFRVVAGDVTVTVLGTVFTIDHDTPDVTVAVREGRVQVDHPWGRTVLSAGERWSRAEEAARHRPDLPVAMIWAERSEAPVTRDPTRRPGVGESSSGSAPFRGSGRDFARLLDRVESGETTPSLVEALDAYARAEPALAVEAHALALEVRARIDPPEQVLQELDDWLALNPRHPRMPDLLEARATVARARLERCDQALPSYRTLAHRTRGMQQARALAWQGLCASGMGLSNEARVALRASLQAGVDGELAEAVERTLDQL